MKLAWASNSLLAPAGGASPISLRILLAGAALAVAAGGASAQEYPVKPSTALTPISALWRTPLVIVYARSNPGKLSYGTSGFGTMEPKVAAES